MATEINIQQNAAMKAPRASVTAQAVDVQKQKMDSASTANQAVADDKPIQAAEKQETVSRDSLEGAVKTMSDFAKGQNRDLQFSIDDSTGRTLVKVVDSETDKVIRQIPSEEALALAKRMEDNLGGIIEEIA